MGRVVSSTVILTLTVIVAMAAPAATAQEGRRDKLHGVGRILKDVDYVGDAAYADDRDKLDIYVPASGDAHPVVVFYHGGGLQGGHKSESEHVGQTLAAAGIVAVVPNYRLSPDVAHPAHAEDAAAALAWTHKHIDAHGGDPSRIYLSGHSAGAYLAVLLAMDTRYLKAVGMASSDLAGVIPISGFFYVERVAPDRPKVRLGHGGARLARSLADAVLEGGRATPSVSLR